MIRRITKHWRPLAAILILVLAVVGVRRVREKQAQKKRDEAYEAILQAYSAALMPGTARKDVESYLRAKNVAFQQMCCVERKAFSDGVYDDLVKIGQEDVPWFCSENNVYIALQFAGTGHPKMTPDADPLDRLRAVTIFHWLAGCL